MAHGNGVCKMCGEEKELQLSHIFSRFLYKPIHGENPQYLELESANRSVKKGQGGIREYLLCSKCEGKRSLWERYADSFLNEREPLLWKKILPNLFEVSGINYSKLKLFALSTLWLISISNLREFERITLGPHAEKIKEMLVDEDPGPTEKYGVGMQKITDNYSKGILLSQTNKVRFDGHVGYRMVFGGYAWLIIVTNHKLSENMEHIFINESGQAYIHCVSARDIGFLMDAAGKFPLDVALSRFARPRKL